MDDIVVVVPSLQPQRSKELSFLMSSLGEQFPSTVVVCLDRGDARRTYDMAWEAGARLAKRWIVQMDDDVFLSPDFGSVVPSVLAVTEHDAVTFYSNSKRDMECLVRGIHYRTIPPSSFYGECCLAIRAKIIPSFLIFAQKWYDENQHHAHAHDLVFGAFMSLQKKKIGCYIPSQVQHRDVDSFLGHRAGKRQSRSFREVYGEI